MTRRRFYAAPENFSPDLTRVKLAAEEARHLRDVLRLRPGDEAYVFDGAGHEYLCEVAAIGARDGGGNSRNERSEKGGRAELTIVRAVAPAQPESPLHLTLALALLKGEKFDLVVQKATELGVTRIVPIMSARADVRLREEKDRGDKRGQRLERLALEAAKQSGRARVPQINSPFTFEAFLAKHQDPDEQTRWFFSERGGDGFDEVASDVSFAPSSITALVGPEGGWDDEEIACARAHNWRIITLGGRTLRAETAAIAIVALLQHRFGDLS